MRTRIFTLIFFISFSFSQFDWVNDGSAIRQGLHIEWQRAGDANSDGTMIIAWSDCRNGGIRDVIVQKIDIDGTNLWGDYGVVAVNAPGRQEDPILITDGSGGAYVVWMDYRDESDDYGDIYAQHVLSNGSLAWDETGVALTNQTNKQYSPNICTDGQGGAFVIWKDNSVSSYGDNYGTHLSQDGPLAPGIGFPIVSYASARGTPSLEFSGGGGAVLVWSDDRNVPEGMGEDIYGQRIQLDGDILQTMWSAPEEGGIPLIEAIYDQTHPRVTYLTDTSTIIVWQDKRNVDDYDLPTYNDIYYQILDENSAPILEPGGRAVCIGNWDIAQPRVKADGSNAFVVWEDKRSDWLFPDIYSQKIGENGTILWEENGEAISTANEAQQSVRLTTDGQGGVYIVWEDSKDFYTDTLMIDIYLQHINANNEFSFDVGGQHISSEKYNQFKPLVRPDGTGGSFVVWGDQRSGGSIGLFTQHVHPEQGITLIEGGQESFFGIATDAANDAYHHNILYLGNDKSLVYWQDNRQGPPTIYGAIIDNNFDYSSDYFINQSINGKPLTNMNVTPGTEGVIDKEPKIILSDDHLFLSFISYDDPANLYFQLLDLDLNIIGEPTATALADPETSKQGFYMVMGEDGYIYIAYSEDYDIVIKKLNSSGIVIWTNQAVQNGTADDIIKAVYPSPEGGCIIIYGSQSWLEGSHVYGLAIQGDGQIPENWPDDGINISSLTGDQYYDNSVATSTGVFATFIESSTGSYNLYGQLLSFDGELLSGPEGISISSGEFDEKSSSLAFNSDLEEIFTCWENTVADTIEDETINTESDIHCTKLNLENQSLGPLLELSSQDYDQLNPHIYWTGNNYLITWEDYRNSTVIPEIDIYFQKVNSDNLDITYDGGGISLCVAPYKQTKPRIFKYSDSSESFVIIWEDYRSTGKEYCANLYGQSITYGELMSIDVHVSNNVDWNLVSLPVDVTDGSLSAVFPEGTGGTLYAFDVTYVGVDALMPGNGYWLHFPNSGTTTITGSSITSLTVNLTAGWNLISGVSEVTNVTNISDPDGIVIPGTVYGFTGSYTNASVFTPGHGYWINASANGDITISSDGAAKTRSAFTDRTVKANKLSFNGNDLFFGVSIPEEEKLSYQLPPKPPAGAFDMRFADNMKVAENSGDIEIMNNTDKLTISCTINIDAGEHMKWVLTSDKKKEYDLNGSGEIVVSEDVTRFTLNKVPGVPLTYSVSQNYPNPFNPVTSIRYEIPVENFVTISVYNVMGQKVTNLVHELRPAGYHHTTWNSTNMHGEPVSSGVYIYTVTAGNYHAVKKLVLMK